MDRCEINNSRLKMKKSAKAKSAKPAKGESGRQAEAFLQFQIRLNREETEEQRKIITELESENRRRTELLEQVRKEHLKQMGTLHKQLKELEELQQSLEANKKKQVKQAQQDNLEAARQEEDRVAELQRHLEHLEEQRKEHLEEQQRWLQYQNVDRIQYQQHIDHLQSELTSEQKMFEESLESCTHCLEAATFSDLDRTTSQLMDKAKQLAIKNAVKQLDISMCKEIKKNELLKKELAIYRSTVCTLEEMRRLEEDLQL